MQKIQTKDWVDEFIEEFIDLYIQKSSMGGDNFMEFWEEDYCQNNNIDCNQEQLVALVERAEQMGEIEPGELTVGLRGC